MVVDQERATFQCDCLFSDPIRHPNPINEFCGCTVLGQVAWRKGIRSFLAHSQIEWPRMMVEEVVADVEE